MKNRKAGWVLACFMVAFLAAWKPVAEEGGVKPDQKEVSIDELNTSAAMKSWVLCGFAEGFNWPQSAKSGAFRIGVLDDPDLLKFVLNNCNMTQYGNQIVEVTDVPEVPDGSFYHILYVGNIRSAAWKQWKKEVRDAPTLVVTQEEGGVPEMATVNFHFVNGIMRFQLDESRAQAMEISIGNELRSWVE